MNNLIFLIDLIGTDITGKQAEAYLGLANMTCNKNSVPNDPRSPFVTSGIRIGTLAMTTRGFDEACCRQVAMWICDLLDHCDDLGFANDIKTKVIELCQSKPIYQSLSE